MSLDPAWRPNEPSKLLKAEKFMHASLILGAAAYGFHIAVYFSTMYNVWMARQRRHKWLFSAFSTWLFIFASLNIIGNGIGSQWAYIDNRNFPGGPMAFLAAHGNTVNDVFGNVAGVMVTWTSDALLLWRCYTVWAGNGYVIILPTLMWISIIVLGCLTCYTSSLPSESIASIKTVNFNLPFWAVAVTLNMLLTILILWRVLYTRNHAIKTLGDQYGTHYTNAAAIIVESAAPYAALGLVWIVLYGIHNVAFYFFLPLLVQVEAISPELIISRVARGRGWTSTTEADITTTPSGPLRFAAKSTSRSEDSGTMDATVGGSHVALSMRDMKPGVSRDTFKDRV